MPTNKQRREAARRHLERQLEHRQEREARRKKVTLITSIAGTIVLIAAVIVTVVLLGNSDKKTPPKAGGKSSSTGATTTTSPSATQTAPVGGPCPKPTHNKTTVVFDCVTVGNLTDLTKAPQVTSSSPRTPKKLAYKDLVVGKGKAAAPNDKVTVQYVGVQYQNGTLFDSSWSRGQAATFALKSGPQGVIPGFAEGIGGTKGVPPMKVGGRRIIVMPSSLAYGTTGNQSIPPNTPLVFVVDLTKVA